MELTREIAEKALEEAGDKVDATEKAAVEADLDY